ncbi:MAG: leucine-rich repeat domain-containing protein [Verrucomicrobiales bacterium]|nr:leucine-rich repeat domain-containing protein [Verrucomicrobiales bacterium]
MLCLLFSLTSCRQSRDLSDWIGSEKLDPEDSSALQEWISANGFQASDFEVVDTAAKRSENSVQIDSSQILKLRATGVRTLTGLLNLTRIHTLELSEYTGDNLSGCPLGLTFLQLYGGNLSSLHGLESCHGLVSLSIMQTSLPHLNHIEGLPALTELTVNGLPWTEATIPPLPALTRLDLSDNRLTAVHGLQGLPKLKSLFLRGNHLESLSGLNELPSLQRVNLNGNRFTDISRVSPGKSVEKLEIKDNPIRDLSPLEEWSGLKSLVFEGDAETIIPETVANLSGSGRQPSGPADQKAEARRLKTAYLEKVNFVEKLPRQPGGSVRRMKSTLKSSFSSFGPVRISGSIDIEQLRGLSRLKVASTSNPLYISREVKVEGTVSVKAGRLEVYSPVEINFYDLAAPFVANPTFADTGANDLNLKGWIITDIPPGTVHPFTANLLPMGNDFTLLLSAQHGDVSGVEITLK